MQPVLWKRFSSEVLSTMRTTLGVLSILAIEIRPINCASSGLIWLKSSRLLIAILSSHCTPFAISRPVPANPEMERNNIQLRGWFMQVIVCVCRMPFIWRPQRALRTLSSRQGPAPNIKGAGRPSSCKPQFLEWLVPCNHQRWTRISFVMWNSMPMQEFPFPVQAPSQDKPLGIQFTSWDVPLGILLPGTQGSTWQAGVYISSIGLI